MITPTMYKAAAYYTVCTFILAVLWHIVIFADTYEAIGYIGREEPGFVLGLVSIAVQGVVLAFVYDHMRRGREAIIAMGVFLWSSHVVAAAAKNEIDHVSLFFCIETLYLCVQFGIAYTVYSRVFSKR